jgi:hypothetical protein
LDSQLPEGMSGEKLKELERGPVSHPLPEEAPLSPPKFITQVSMNHICSHLIRSVYTLQYSGYGVPCHISGVGLKVMKPVTKMMRKSFLQDVSLFKMI